MYGSNIAWTVFAEHCCCKTADWCVWSVTRCVSRYCNQVLSREIDECCTQLLQRLVRCQDHTYRSSSSSTSATNSTVGCHVYIFAKWLMSVFWFMWLSIELLNTLPCIIYVVYYSIQATIRDARTLWITEVQMGNVWMQSNSRIHYESLHTKVHCYILMIFCRLSMWKLS